MCLWPNAMDSIYDSQLQNWNEGQNFKNRDAKTGQFFLAVGSASILERGTAKIISGVGITHLTALSRKPKSMVEFFEAEIKHP